MLSLPRKPAYLYADKMAEKFNKILRECQKKSAGSRIFKQLAWICCGKLQFEPAWACAQRLSRPPPFRARLSQRNRKVNIIRVLLNLP